jgi:hypothetical protein
MSLNSSTTKKKSNTQRVLSTLRESTLHRESKKMLGLVGLPLSLSPLDQILSTHHSPTWLLFTALKNKNRQFSLGLYF